MDAILWKNMFVLSVPVFEKILRPVIVYLFLIVGLRLSGKRELAQLNPFDFVVLLTLSNTVQNAIIGNDNSVTGGVLGATTLLVVNYLVVRFLYRHNRLDELVLISDQIERVAVATMVLSPRFAVGAFVFADDEDGDVGRAHAPGTVRRQRIIPSRDVSHRTSCANASDPLGLFGSFADVDRR